MKLVLALTYLTFAITMSINMSIKTIPPIRNTHQNSLRKSSREYGVLVLPAGLGSYHFFSKPL
jgi:hypothetical protein